MTNQMQATAYKNGLLNIKDGNGVTQTYYITSGGYTWRDYDGQIDVAKTPGSWSDFWARLQSSYEEAALKPCPFCGSTMCQTYLSGEFVYVRCNMCNSTSGLAESRAAAVAAWNRRALETQA